ncbi:MAG: CvpA family protein [Burkholderiales bacterium]|nr:CvpA family protein [Burkholderiales bacterium]MDE2453549.1 CvpA family protein [Burkholderiales bacterium]
MAAGLGWVDWTMAGVLALSVLVGLLRGFVFEAMTLAGWFVAWFAAQWFAVDAGHRIPFGAPGSAVNHAAAFALCFIAAIIVWGLVARLIRLLVRATPLSPADRLLGAVFGLLRGAVFLLAVATVVVSTPAAQSALWRESTGAAALVAALDALKPLLPQPLLPWQPA